MDFQLNDRLKADICAFRVFLKYLRDEEEMLGIVRPFDESYRKKAYDRWMNMSDSERLKYRKNNCNIVLPDPPFGKVQNDLPTVSEQNSTVDELIVVETTDNQEVDLVIDNLPKEIQPLAAYIGDDYASFNFCIAATNVFVKNSEICIPAEIGINKLSFNKGIVQSFHAFIDPGDTIPIVAVADVVEFSAEWHKIPHVRFNFPALETVLKDIHSFTHTVKIDDRNEAFIFVEDDELEQARTAFATLAARSTDLQQGLEWRLNVLSLRRLFSLLKARLSLAHVPETDGYVAFKTAKYNYTDLCDFHDKKDCRYCAQSKAYINCYVLSDYFSSGFGAEKLKRIEDKKTGACKYLRE